MHPASALRRLVRAKRVSFLIVRSVEMQPQSSNDSYRRCAFFLPKRKRNCRLKVAEGFQYCSDHALRNNEPVAKPRVECPYDPNHSVWVHRLKKHLKVCNSRPKEKPVYFQQNINIDSTSEEYSGKTELASFTPVEIKEIIRKVKLVEAAHLLDSVESVLSHDALADELADDANGPSARKHLDQLSSLLGNMGAWNLFTSDTCFVEFGAGKGRLSQWIFDAVTETSNTHFILIDKKNVRHKRDLHHQEVRQNLSMERLITDIRDLAIHRVPAIRENKNRPIVGYCKHLCGTATDLALRCLFPQTNDTSSEKELSSILGPCVKGIAMATCCHHCCDWNSYVGKDFLNLHGFDRTEFEAIIRLSSWATCGSRTGHSEEESERPKESSTNGDEEGKETLTRAIGLSIPEREGVGRMCKRLLDAGRIDFLQRNKMLARQVQYVGQDITKENVLILGKTEVSQTSDI